MTDEQRLDWLEEDWLRLDEIRRFDRFVNYARWHNVPLRDAIDQLAELEREPVDVVIDN